MKLKQIILLFTLFGCALPGFSQRGLKVGFSVGPTLSRATPVDLFPAEFSRKNKVGYTGGFLLHYGFTRSLSVDGGVSFVRPGYRVSNDSNSKEQYIKSHYNALNIPIYLSLRQPFGQGGFIKENLGIALHTRLGDSKEQTLKNAENGNFLIKQRITNAVQPMVVLGLEFGTVTDNGNVVTVAANYYYAMKSAAVLDVYANNGTAKTFEMNYRGNYFSLTLNWMFNMSNLKKTEEFFTD